MEKNEERPDAGADEKRPDADAEEERRPEEARLPHEPAETQTREIETETAALAQAQPTRPRRYIPTAAISLGVLVLGVALFAAGFWTHSLLDDDLDLSPVEDKLVALDVQAGNIDDQIAEINDRTAEIEDILSGAVVNAEGGDEPPANPAAATSSASNDDPAFGPEDAAVVIVEFSDFQCPYCSKFSTETLPSIREAYGDTVRFIFRDYPLNSIHPYAQKAAEAGQCAQEQGLFWEYHDLLFANPEALTVPDLKNFAEQVGADATQFDDCLDSGKNQNEAVLDLQDGQAAGITGTPGFVINGLLLKGAQPFEVFQQVIDQLLAEE